MENDSNNISPSYIKADGNIILNEKFIRWVKKMDECLAVCAKFEGCDIDYGTSTLKICKINNPDSYNKLNKFFDS